MRKPTALGDSVDKILEDSAAIKIDERHSLVKIPTFGPGSHLGPEVLISSVVSKTSPGRSLGSGRGSVATYLPSIGLPNGGHDMVRRLLPGGTSPRGSLASARVRSSHAGVSLSTAGAALAKGSWSAREPRLQKQAEGALRNAMMEAGWRSKLCKGDQTHRLRDCRPDIGEKRAREDAGTPAPLSHVASRGQHELEATSPVPRDVTSVASVSHPCEARQLLRASAEEGGAVSSGRRKASALALSSEVSAARQGSIRACFHLEGEEILAAIVTLQLRHNTSEMDGRSETRVPEVAALESQFESSGLAAMAERRCLLKKAGGEVDDTLLGIGNGDTASSTEISTSTSVLNFYRWLCGLPPVRLNSARLTVCNIVSVALLPRAQPSAPLDSCSADFVDTLTGIVGFNGGRLSVLHGEASLLAAMEQSLSSTHTLGNAADTFADLTEHANSLADKVALLNPAAVACLPESKGELHRQGKDISARKSSYDHEVLPLLHANDLPAPLKPLRVFWDLQAGLSKSSIESKVGSKALTVKSQSTSKAVRGRAVHSSELSSIWADRHGSLAFRRCLLNPALREFGAARRHDTCVLWTGTDQALEDNASNFKQTFKQRTNAGGVSHEPSTDQPLRRTSDRRVTKKRSQLQSRADYDSGSQLQSQADYASGRLGAVCWPPSGFVPLTLMQSRSMAWTIMPDCSRFQPTASTLVQAWKVKMERPTDGAAWTAKRVSDVRINGFTIDCSSFGEPFCAIFWPDLGLVVEGLQLEVEMSGLRGEPTTLNFFYEFRNFVQKELDEHLCAEAATFRAVVGDRAFWGEPRCVVLAAADLKHLQQMEQKQRKARQSVAMSLCHRPDPEIQVVSYHETTFTTNCVDVTIVLQSDEVAALYAELHFVRFGGEEEEVIGGAVVQKLLEGNYFLVRAKLPMSRQRFEIRLFASTASHPEDFRKHPLRYVITTSKECQGLLLSMEDRRLRKFGYCQVSTAAQLLGIVVIAPATRRITAGSCYFLVYVDKSVALAAARAEQEQREKSLAESPEGQAKAAKQRATNRSSSYTGSKGFLTGASSSSGPGQPRTSRFYTERLEAQGMPDDVLSKAALAAQSQVRISADRIDEDEASPPGSSSTKQRKGADSAPAAAFLPPSSVARLQYNLRAVLEKRTQDTTEDVQIDVSLRGGEVLHRLRERSDFPGFFEGLFSFNNLDMEKKVELFCRFPIVHAAEYAPRKLGDWFVVQDELLPNNF